jgi:hypothetical protein
MENMQVLLHLVHLTLLGFLQLLLLVRKQSLLPSFSCGIALVKIVLETRNLLMTLGPGFIHPWVVSLKHHIHLHFDHCNNTRTTSIATQPYERSHRYTYEMEERAHSYRNGHPLRQKHVKCSRMHHEIAANGGK